MVLINLTTRCLRCVNVFGAMPLHLRSMMDGTSSVLGEGALTNSNRSLAMDCQATTTGVDTMKNITVSGDIGRFTGGQVLKSSEDKAEYFRTMVNEGADKPTTLTDGEILAIAEATDVSEAKGDEEYEEILRVTAMTEGTGVKPTISALGSSIRENAWSFAKGLPKSFDKAMQAGFTAKDTIDQLPIELAFDINTPRPRGYYGPINA